MSRRVRSAAISRAELDEAGAYAVDEDCAELLEVVFPWGAQPKRLISSSGERREHRVHSGTQPTEKAYVLHTLWPTTQRRDGLLGGENPAQSTPQEGHASWCAPARRPTHKERALPAQSYGPHNNNAWGTRPALPGMLLLYGSSLYESQEAGACRGGPRADLSQKTCSTTRPSEDVTMDGNNRVLLWFGRIGCTT